MMTPVDALLMFAVLSVMLELAVLWRKLHAIHAALLAVADVLREMVKPAE